MSTIIWLGILMGMLHSDKKVESPSGFPSHRFVQPNIQGSTLYAYIAHKQLLLYHEYSQQRNKVHTNGMHELHQKDWSFN